MTALPYDVFQFRPRPTHGTMVDTVCLHPVKTTWSLVLGKLLISALMASHHETSRDAASKAKTWWIGFF